MMVLVKVRNAAELLWDSLDARERRVLLLGAAWVALTAFSLVTGRAAREALVADVADEVERRGR